MIWEVLLLISTSSQSSQNWWADGGTLAQLQPLYVGNRRLVTSGPSRVLQVLVSALAPLILDVALVTTLELKMFGQ